VVAPDALDLVGVAAHDRLNDALVLPVAKPAEVRLAEHAGAEVPDAPIPQPVGHPDQQAVPRLVDDDAVELRVAVMPGLGIVASRRPLHRPEELAEPPDVGGSQVRHSQAGRQRFYSFEDLIGIRAAKELLAEGIALQNVRRSVEALRASLPRGARPLSSLRIVADGHALVVRGEHGSFEPTTGQLRLDFEVRELRDDVVRVLRRSGRQNDVTVAHQHYLEGCRFDEDEAGFERAEAAYRRAIELDPSLANAFTNLGNLMFRRARYEEAQNLYVRALQLDPDQPEAFYNLGFLLYERGDVAGASLNFKRALRSDPSFADAHFNLAMALTEGGERLQAREHWQTYLKLDPDSPWAEIARQHLTR